ncbi:unnamed protein product [Rotaria sordida]|uniref:Flavin-containing monooxygenase n=1 Tax=Rotaria sordida TaxID=392033 RepID=A0A814WT27_9BILA|nr:unnamed protein product [Rotaria sordida]
MDSAQSEVILAAAAAESPPHSSMPTRPSNWVPIREQYRGQPRPLKIITIGAGFSGLTMAYKIQHQYKLGDHIQHVIYEKNLDIGGTWEYKHAQTIALFDTGFTISHVGHQLNISWTCVKNAIKRYCEHGTFKDLSRMGRPSKITPRTAHHLKRLTNGENQANVNIITQKLNDSSTWCVSSRRPPKSPDLNVVGELCGIIDKKLASKPINTKTDSQKRLQEEWDNIPNTLYRALVDSMSERIEKCLKAQEGHFL